MEKSRKQYLKEFLQEEPGDSFSRYALALEYLKENEGRQAILELEALIKADENYLAAYYQLGKAYEMESHSEQAKQIYLKGIDVAKAQKKGHTLKELQFAYNSLMGIVDDYEDD